jgi:predicted DCC family thiol-disulfide oxidoreductase YuxK
MTRRPAHPPAAPPGARLAAPMLVYDGDCGFCSASARLVCPDRVATVQRRAWQELPAATLAAWQLSADQLQQAAWLVDPDGRRWRGHRAIARALAAAGGWRRPIGIVLGVPPLAWFGAPVYAVLARIRHRLPPRRGACRLPR